MQGEELQKMIQEIRQYVLDHIGLMNISDEELKDKIKDIVDEKLGNRYVPIKQKLLINQQVFSSIRGLGLLDTIMRDDNVTEIMINGPDHIFIEKNGKLKKLDQHFESERRLEDIIQKIVGMAGREVNRANPIVDTRLPNGSRVNVVLPPISLQGAIVTIRKFSKTPMTMEQLMLLLIIML